MDPRQRPTGQHFILRPLDLERMRSLKGQDRYEQKVEWARANAQKVVDAPLQPWDGTKGENAWSQNQRFADLMNVATLYLLTGEQPFAEACKQNVMTAVGVSEANSSRILSTDYIQETFLNKSILFIHEWLPEVFTPEERERIKQTCIRCMPHHAWEMARSTVNQKLIQNHIQHDSTGMAMVALYFNDFKDADRWGLFAAETAVRYMRDAFHGDGGQNEVATTYHAGCLRSGLLIYYILRDFADRDLMKESWFREVIEKGIAWAGSLITPSGNMVPFNDSGDHFEACLFRFGASQFNNPHYQALADIVDERTDGGSLLYDLLYYEPSIPARLDSNAQALFPLTGTATFRTGYEKDSGLLAQKAGSYIGGHAHRDRLGFAYWHSGQCVLEDPGGFKADWATFVGYCKESSSHNVVAIHDPHPLTFEGRTEGMEHFSVEHRGHDKSQGRILEAREEEHFAVSVMQAYIYKDVLQKRKLVWLKRSGTLLVFDRIESENEYPFDQLFHGVGKLGLQKNRFVFKDPEISLSGSVMAPPVCDLIALERPENAKGSGPYVAVRVKGTCINYLTLLEPFKTEPPPARALDENGNLALKLEDGTLNLQLIQGELTVTLEDLAL